ncbi:NAD(P)-binding domain-containing protein [Cellulomonas sp. PhB150]|uniref:NAD(P)-binding domain-containing protein n=1 Tax=Cellulomonas sp. PhB150 TaxID=2485188 RepID=UPI000FB8692C|nr:NAD(P)-binding domain-containing protein [Cellulomonas sp. PhB150]ROS31668.1 cation diffusion facilitator CzcD-associated flavoprotein CzcO [Cellulomonas sp. PhB150]
MDEPPDETRKAPASPEPRRPTARYDDTMELVLEFDDAGSSPPVGGVADEAVEDGPRDDDTVPDTAAAADETTATDETTAADETTVPDEAAVPDETTLPDGTGPADESGAAAEPPRAEAAPSRRQRRERGAHRAADGPVEVDVVVIGAGQAGLSSAHHLRTSGYTAVGERGWERAERTFVVLDDAPAPGGAWQHRWPGLTMADAHGVHELPGMPFRVVDAAEPAARAVPYYFAQYEDAFDLHVQRPVKVSRVSDVDGWLVVESHSVEQPDEGVAWRARGIVNASGTWSKPFWPVYPGQATFRGRQLHTHDYRTPQDLADGHVVVVGGGTSAVQLLLALAPVTTTTWVTRRVPRWRDEEFTPEVGRAAVALVEERTRAGLPPQSVVSVTGLPLTPAYRAGIESGVLVPRPMFSRLTATGAQWDDPSPAGEGWATGPASVEAATVLWCTGFRAALDHLAPLHLRGSGGGIVMDGTSVVADPRIQLVGYGPSASTIGANRAGREAARNLLALAPR